MCDDARDVEAEKCRQLARGDCHEVVVRVTIQGIVTMPGSNHETDDLRAYLGEAVGNGEVVDWEEV